MTSSWNPQKKQDVVKNKGIYDCTVVLYNAAMFFDVGDHSLKNNQRLCAKFL